MTQKDHTASQGKKAQYLQEYKNTPKVKIYKVWHPIKDYQACKEERGEKWGQ